MQKRLKMIFLKMDRYTQSNELESVRKQYCFIVTINNILKSHIVMKELNPP